MSLVKWEPFRELATLRDRLDRLFSDPFFSPTLEEGTRTRLLAEWVPAVDVYEDENQWVISAELPGMDMKDIDVKIEDETLKISGERKLEHEDKRENYHRVERVYGSFYRAFTLPRTVDTEKVKAHYEKGILRVTLPKREEVKPRKVNIEIR